MDGWMDGMNRSRRVEVDCSMRRNIAEELICQAHTVSLSPNRGLRRWSSALSHVAPVPKRRWQSDSRGELVNSELDLTGKLENRDGR
jgi:hypothetical protein